MQVCGKIVFPLIRKFMNPFVVSFYPRNPRKLVFNE